jgi:hypothetical protein
VNDLSFLDGEADKLGSDTLLEKLSAESGQ